MTGLRGPLRKRESHLWERETNDRYVEPAWVSERLFATRGFTRGMTVLDPACGFGTIVEEAHRAGLHGLGSDIVRRWEARAQLFPSVGIYREGDFLNGEWPVQDTPGFRWPDAIVSNPPFKHAERFAELALERAISVVALLLPANWVQGAKRSRWLASSPLHRVLFVCPRPSMPPGHVILAGGKPGNGTTDYAIFVWLKGYQGEPQIGWLRRDEAGP